VYNRFTKNALKDLDRSLIICAPVAQWIERNVADVEVVGSNPIGGAIDRFGGVAEWLKASVSKTDVPVSGTGGSNPPPSAKTREGSFAY
jgi:hypothetical protein